MIFQPFLSKGKSTEELWFDHKIFYQINVSMDEVWILPVCASILVVPAPQCVDFALTNLLNHRIKWNAAKVTKIILCV